MRLEEGGFVLIDGGPLGLGRLLETLICDDGPGGGSIEPPAVVRPFCLSVMVELPAQLPPPASKLVLHLRREGGAAAGAEGAESKESAATAAASPTTVSTTVSVGEYSPNMLGRQLLVKGLRPGARALLSVSALDMAGQLIGCSRWAVASTLELPDESKYPTKSAMVRDAHGVERGACGTRRCCCDAFRAPWAESEGRSALNDTNLFNCAACGCAASAHEAVGGVDAAEEEAEVEVAHARSVARGSSAAPPPPPPLSAEEAATRRDALVARFEEWAASCSWRELGPVHQLWCISDVHIEHPENRHFIEELPPIFGRDGIIVAGDVCTLIETLRSCLATLVTKFGHVFYVCGNHEMWLAPSEAQFGDSVDKFFGILQMCEELGVHAAPALVRGEAGGAADGGDGRPALAVLPLHSWYHDEFLSDEVREKAAAWEEEIRRRFDGPPGPPAPPAEAAAEAGGGGDASASKAVAERQERRRRRDDERVETMDLQAKWPQCLDGVAEGASKVETLSAFFARLNDGMLRTLAELPASRRPRATITYSHFLPVPKLHRGPVFLGRVEGSALLGEQVRAVAPTVHVFGHTHYDIDTRIGGIRYVQRPLGYPKERRIRHEELRRIRISTGTTDWYENPPLTLLWSAAGGS